MRPRQLVPRSAATVVGVGGIVVSVVWTYSALRDVMGSQGGPADVWVIQLAVIGGLVCVGLYAAFGLPAGPRLALLAWPAFFLSVGWLFFADAERDGRGVWWADGVLFAVLGGAVLVPLLVTRPGRRMLWSDGTDGPTADVLLRRSRPRQPRNIDELFAELAGRPGPAPAAVRAAQTYSVVLHGLVLVSALWLGLASFAWMTAG